MRLHDTRLRRASANDLTEMVGVQRRSVAAGYPDSVRSLLIANPEIVSDELKKRWIEGAVFVVAEFEQQLIGFAAARVGSNVAQAELVALFVEPSRWRSGVGTVLTECITQILSGLGVDRLSVLANPLVEGFYRKTGLVPDGLVQMANYSEVPRFVMAIDSKRTNSSSE